MMLQNNKIISWCESNEPLGQNKLPWINNENNRNLGEKTDVGFCGKYIDLSANICLSGVVFFYLQPIFCVVWLFGQQKKKQKWFSLF